MYHNLLKRNLICPKLRKNELIKEQIQIPTPRKKSKRHVDQQPQRILDASMLQDDFYISVLDWSNKNHISIGLANAVFIWEQETNKIVKITENEGYNLISGVKFDQSGDRLVISDLVGNVRIFDVQN